MLSMANRQIEFWNQAQSRFQEEEEEPSPLGIRRMCVGSSADLMSFIVLVNGLQKNPGLVVIG